MILGVLVRDVDSGNAEREPIKDPTGWKYIDAAGTRPSEKPLISIGRDKNISTTSIHSRSNSNPQAGMSFMSNAHLEFLNKGNTTVSEQTPRPNQFGDGQGVFEGKQPQFLVDKELNAEPESSTLDSGGSSRVSMSSGLSSRSQIHPLERPRQYYQQQEKPLPPSPQDTYITQPPNPIQPPRITANLRPNFRQTLSSQSLPQRTYGQQQEGSSSGSTSSSFNTAINYGGANGGKMTEVEKKRYELQMRVYRARTQMPSHIVLRIFREPSECVEVEEMLRRGLN